MCEGKMPGFFARQAIYAEGKRLNRKAAQCDGSCHQPQQQTVRQRFDQATEHGKTFLAVVGTVCVMAALGAGALGRLAGVGLVVLEVTGGVLAALAVAAGAYAMLRGYRTVMQRESGHLTTRAHLDAIDQADRLPPVGQRVTRTAQVLAITRDRVRP